MKKRIRQLTAAFAAMTMIIGTMPSMAMADNAYKTPVSDSGADQNKTNINSDSVDTPNGKAVLTKSLVIEEDANIPETLFNYTIESPAAANGATGDALRYVSKSAGNGTTVSVLRGINANKILVTGWDADGNKNTTPVSGALATVTENLALALNDGSTAVPAVGSVDNDVYNDKPVITLKYNKQQVVRTAAATPDTSNYVITEATAEDDDVYIVDYKQAESSDGSTEGAKDYTYYTANKTMLLDFTNCGFTEPGIYRYLITESGTNLGITNDTTAVRTLDVYVEHRDSTNPAYVGGTANNDLVIVGYVLYKGDLGTKVPKSESIPANANAVTLVDGSTTANQGGNVSGDGVKSSGWQNVYDTSKLTIGKKVEGNQGSKDKYFEFTITVKGANAADKFRVEVSGLEDETKKDSTKVGSEADDAYPNAATAYTNAAIFGTTETPANNAITYFDVNGTDATTYKVYLKNGQYVTLTGLPAGAKYTVTETTEDYTRTHYGDFITDSTDASKTGLIDMVKYVKSANGSTLADVAEVTANKSLPANTSDITETPVTSDDAEYAFVNEKKGVLPTGIIMSVAPAVIVGIGVLAAIFALVLGGKKKELDEE